MIQWNVGGVEISCGIGERRRRKTRCEIKGESIVGVYLRRMVITRGALSIMSKLAPSIRNEGLIYIDKSGQSLISISQFQYYSFVDKLPPITLLGK